MSYILDALRRAEAERGRGAVPGIHSQAVPASGRAPAAARSTALPLWIGGAVALAAVVAAGGMWWVMHRSAPQGGVVLAAAGSAAQPASVATTPAVSSLPPAVPVLTPSVAQVAPVAPVVIAPAERVVPVPPAKRAVAAPSAREKPAPVAAPPRARSPDAAGSPLREPAERERAKQASPTATGGAAPVSPVAAVAPTGAVFAQADLPEAVRGQLPVLKISGITYSSNPVSRMAIVNGQVMHEGDPAAPGLMLERIEPGRTVWSFRGYRYGLAP